MRRFAIVAVLVGACFEQAPTIEGVPSTTGDGSDGSGGSGDTSTGGTGPSGSFCGDQAGAIICFDFDASASLPDEGQKSARNGGTLTVVDDGFESPRAMAAALDGMLDGVAMLRVDHLQDHVTHAFALRLESGCVPPAAGVVLASYATFVTPDIEAARVELVLLPDDRLGLRRGTMMSEEVIAEIASPPLGQWAELVWEVHLQGAMIEMLIGDGTHSDSGTAVTLGTLGMGRRSGIGLGSPAATTCTATFDDVLFTPP